jgi:hypothetical protein
MRRDLLCLLAVGLGSCATAPAAGTPSRPPTALSAGGVTVTLPRDWSGRTAVAHGQPEIRARAGRTLLILRPTPASVGRIFGRTRFRVRGSHGGGRVPLVGATVRVDVGFATAPPSPSRVSEIRAMLGRLDASAAQRAARGRPPLLDRLLSGGPRLWTSAKLTASGQPGALHRVLVLGCPACRASPLTTRLLRDPQGGCPPAGADVWLLPRPGQRSVDEVAAALHPTLVLRIRSGRRLRLRHVARQRMILEVPRSVTDGAADRVVGTFARLAGYRLRFSQNFTAS